MKQFSKIFKFEFLNYLKNKVFLIMTIAIIVVIAGVLTVPALLGMDGQEETSAPADGRPVIAVLENTQTQGTTEFLAQALPAFTLEKTDETEESLRASVQKGDYAAVLVMRTPLSYRYIVDSMGMFDTTQQQIDAVLVSKYQVDVMQEAGMSAEEAQGVLTAQTTPEVVEIGTSQMQSFFYTYILILLLYIAIILYGQFVATGVAAEKSSRAMELLITSAKPESLMFGKVMGIGSAGLLQMALILGSGFLFYQLNASYWQGNMIISSIFGMPLSMLLYTLLFFVLGFFIYAFLFGALGSLANRSEDVNTLVLPVTMLFIVAFLVVMTSMGSGSIDSPLMIACSYIPFTSPMAMFTRIAMGGVAAWEIILSVAILVTTTIGVGYLSAAIYRVGVLLYGKPPKLSELFRILKRSKQ